ncbi:MAG: TonB-dependent receptor [Candidatus Kapabacteria bacterium]|nr:TonB-dependent receptor [Candidatus Kapabacteria bacterium]
MRYKFILTLIMLVGLSGDLIASNAADTIKIYQLGDINVTGAFSQGRIAASNISTVNYHILQKSDVSSAAELQLYIPSAKIRTNSRGESMLFLRGAGERQLGLFFDGIPLNVAWDNRFDMSMLPVDIIGKIDVNKNANSIMYGPNVLGGAINISTIERAVDGIGGNVRLMNGEAGLIQMSATNDGKIGSFNYIASFSHVKTDGVTLSANRPDSLLNQDMNSSLRTNTDKDFYSFYARGEYDISGAAKLGLSVLHITGEKGVGAETHIEGARFWRFPEWKRTIIATNGEVKLSENGDFKLRGTLWYDLFDQITDSYSDMTYRDVTTSQQDKDKTGGARIALSWDITENQNLSYALNWYNINHSEKIDANPESLFSQNILSSGLSYNWFSDLFSFKAGVVFDYFSTGDAGVFNETSGKTQSDFGAFAGLKYLVAEDVVIFGNFSRRTRFPTMREAYSGALDRFVTNPDLKPETGILTELGLSYTYESFSIELAGFANLYDDLIEQIRLTKEQDSLRRRMRVNFSKASIIGSDMTLRLSPFRNMFIETNFTLMFTDGEQDGKKVEYIDNRPEFLTGLLINYKFDFGLNLQGELEGVGKQFERNPDDQTQFIEIGATSVINFRAGYLIPVNQSVIWEIFVRANNILDTYRLSQLGLPEQGRMINAGVSVSL